ncbi:putative Caspase-like domain superfamily [Helianthus annuus]|nr:putative Caspase-like domain superfamily [Helianthus annuus]
MATTAAKQCNTCQRNLVKMPGSQYEVCPVCTTVNLFNQKIKGRVLFRIGQVINAAANQHQHELQRQPSNRGRKRAVLCGITYNNHKKKLEASVHNVRSMQQLLVNKLGFPNYSIIVLTEEESDSSRIPTKHNIQGALKWLVQGSQPGDSLMFYYAGHGTRVRDQDGDEIDGYDEALCPLDYKKAGTILDDEINATIVAPLTHGVTLHSVIDTCHSGTLLDLPFLCTVNQDGFYKWEEHQLTNKGTRGGKAVCISACADDQYSGDTSAFTGKAIGALTFSFIQTMEKESNLTYGKLLASMRKKVNQAQQVVGRFAPHASPMSQEPQLSSSKRFEIYSEPLII